MWREVRLRKGAAVNDAGLSHQHIRLDAKQNQFVSANLPVRDCELYIADTPTDLIAINCEAMIVNASAMEQNDADMIFGYYQEVNGCTDETIIWLDEPKPPKELRKFFKCYNSFDAIKDKLKYLLLTAHSKSKKRTSTAKSWSTG